MKNQYFPLTSKRFKLRLGSR